MIKISVDSRDLDFYQHVGSVDFFEAEFSVDKPEADYIQAPGDTECTAITTCECAHDDTGAIYDFEELFNRVPHGTDGAEPRKVMGEAVKNGLKRKDNGMIEKSFSSYWRADTSSTYDSFDSVRSAMKISKLSIFNASPYYREWFGQTILPLGLNTTTYHAWEISGWTQKNGEPHLICSMWTGDKVYMNRATFNKAINNMGCASWVLSTLEVDKQRRNAFMAILDGIKNALLYIQQQVTQLAFSPSK